jgi:AcrR family transcriptional regulator
VDAVSRMRKRVLDAAVECLLIGGFATGRLHSAIAQRAGLSRPTVYKYVGDQEAILDAVLQRELAIFLGELQTVLDRAFPSGGQISDVIVFVVWHAREHRLLQAALRQIPERVLPWFTIHAHEVIAQLEPMVTPYVEDYLGQSDIPPRVLIDALSRIALSLVFTTGLVELTSPDELRDYLATAARALVGSPVSAP